MAIGHWTMIMPPTYTQHASQRGIQEMLFETEILVVHTSEIKFRSVPGDFCPVFHALFATDNWEDTTLLRETTDINDRRFEFPSQPCSGQIPAGRTHDWTFYTTKCVLFLHHIYWNGFDTTIRRTGNVNLLCRLVYISQFTALVTCMLSGILKNVQYCIQF